MESVRSRQSVFAVFREAFKGSKANKDANPQKPRTKAKSWKSNQSFVQKTVNVSAVKTQTSINKPKDVPEEFSPMSVKAESSDISIITRETASNGNSILPRLRLSSKIHRMRCPFLEKEKNELVHQLKIALQNSDDGFCISDRQVENLLENNDFDLEKALSDYLEMFDLRNIEAGKSLRFVESNNSNRNIFHAWSRCDPTMFNVRYGPQYHKFRTKGPAKSETLYDVFAVDLYCSDRKINRISRYMNIEEHRDFVHPLPKIFILNFMLPFTEPRLFSSDPNGPTLYIHFVMRLSDWAEKNPEHPSIQLARRFMSETGPEGKMKERLKLICQMSNSDDLDLGKVEKGICQNYNGLPFLFRSYNAQYHKGQGWFEADFDGHKSGFATRLGRYSLLGWTEKIVANVAVLVESQTDEEMPERILGCATLHRLISRNATPFVKPSGIHSPETNTAKQQADDEAGDDEFRDAVTDE